MKRLNWKIILSNITEAREQLEQIEALQQKGEKTSEVELQISLEHAYHHMNFAWNIRHAPTKRYANLSDEDFNLWSKFPKEIEVYKIRGKTKTNSANRKISRAGKTRDSVSKNGSNTCVDRSAGSSVDVNLEFHTRARSRQR